MCFSAVGSFTLAGVLGGIGVVSLARNTPRRLRMFAAIPLIFAVQQAAEGVVWLTIASPSQATLHRIAVNAFLGIALVIWPMWSPFALHRAEQDPRTRRVLFALFCSGVVVATGAVVLLTWWQPVAVVAGHSICYNHEGASEAPRQLVTLLPYLIPALVPYFVSTLKLARTIGVTLVVSLFVTVIVEREAFTSVWCFFAAILSVLMAMAVEREREVTPAPRGPWPRAREVKTASAGN